jgi:type I restriction enzyme S subunit
VIAADQPTTRSAPAAWQPGYRLGDGCTIKHGYAFQSSQMTTAGAEDLPIIVNIGNFKYTGGFRFDSTKIQRYFGPLPDGFTLKPGDVLVVMTCQTPKGEILGVPGRIPCDGRTYLHNQRMGLVQITDPEALDLGFLYYLFLSPALNSHLCATATGAKILHTAPTRIEAYRFSRPPLPVQRKIAAILSAYDDLIENNTRRIAVLEEMAHALYREWFVELRFPGHEQVGMVESEIGPIPEGWQVRQLAEVAEVNGRSLRNGHAPDEIAYVDIASVSPGRIDKIERMPFASAPSRARRIVRHGDIIWSAVRPNRRSYSLILNPPPHLIVSTGFAVITPVALPYTYLYHALTTDDFVGYLTNHATGAAYPAVAAKDFEEASALVPPRPLADRFHDLTEPLLLERHNLIAQSEVARRTRDLLLPKLVSGEIDVSRLAIGAGRPSSPMEGPAKAGRKEVR